ncbi:MAG: hypothetical protein H3C53_13245 [Trueperaceae bacterium]|nr:hypothetical protein [Trueperaceae bacterium]
MRILPMLFASLFTFTLAAAQGSIRGTLVTGGAEPYVVIACHVSITDGCDEALSGFAETSGPAGARPFAVDGLAAGRYLLIAWRDLNGNGDAEENEIEVMLGADGEPLVLAPPADGLEFRLAGAAAPSVQPGAPAVQPAAPAVQPGAPAAAGGALGDLPGIWQQTRASAGDYRNLTTGYSFTATSGFSVKLVIDPGGGYYMAYYSSGIQSNCARGMSYYEQSTGTLRVEGSRLVLQPTAHRLDATGCDNPGSHDLGTDPIVYDFRLEQSFDYRGLRTYRLTLEGGPHPLELQLLHHEPLMPGYQAEQPADFVLGDVAVYREFIGTWAYSQGSRLDFYDPATGVFYVPELDGTGHEWLRFTASEYEFARAWRNYNLEGVCKKDYVYYERGTPRFSITDPPRTEGGTSFGHLRLSASAAKLIVTIRECDELDQVLRYDLIPQVSYYTWTYRPETHEYITIAEGFSLQCPWPRDEWQFMICDEEWNHFVRR